MNRVWKPIVTKLPTIVSAAAKNSAIRPNFVRSMSMWGQAKKATSNIVDFIEDKLTFSKQQEDGHEKPHEINSAIKKGERIYPKEPTPPLSHQKTLEYREAEMAAAEFGDNVKQETAAKLNNGQTKFPNKPYVPIAADPVRDEAPKIEEQIEIIEASRRGMPTKTTQAGTATQPIAATPPPTTESPISPISLDDAASIEAEIENIESSRSEMTPPPKVKTTQAGYATSKKAPKMPHGKTDC